MHTQQHLHLHGSSNKKCKNCGDARMLVVQRPYVLLRCHFAFWLFELAASFFGACTHLFWRISKLGMPFGALYIAPMNGWTAGPQCVLYFCQCNVILYSYMRWTIEYLRGTCVILTYYYFLHLNASNANISGRME